MGCDIHLFVEIRKDGEWVSVDEWEKDEDGDIDVNYQNQFYHDRNYEVFAMLANVRNGRGFVGSNTGDGLIPISQPKGLPEDVSKEISDYSDHWGVDGHSHSYLTVQELIEYDWTRVTTLRGHVDALTFFWWERLKQWDDCPREYSGMVSGGRVVHVTEDKMRQLILELSEKVDKHVISALNDNLRHHYCVIEWEQAYYSLAKRFLSGCLPRLFQLGKPEDVRIVFWFDN